MIVATGKIVDRETGKEEAYAMGVLEEKNIPDMLALQEKVLGGEGFNLTWFYPFSHEELTDILKIPGNLALGIFVEERLIAFRVGCCCGREFDEVSGALDGEGGRSFSGIGMLMNGVFVDSRYRGNSLQQMMSEYTIEQEGKQGIRFFFSAIHPDNGASIRSLEKVGFERKKRAMLYQGRYDRMILVKELPKELSKEKQKDE